MNIKDITVVIADDHPQTRKGIRTLLEKDDRIKVVGEAGDGRQALHLVEDLEPDILILDVEMPVMTGLEVARRLKTSSTRFLALSAYDDREYVQEMLANNAAGYLIKDEAPRQLVRAIRGIAEGKEGWVSPQLSSPTGRKPTSVPVPTEIPLTPQELQLLRSLEAYANETEFMKASELPKKRVAQILHDLYQKLNLHTFAEAKKLAIQMKSTRKK